MDNSEIRRLLNQNGIPLTAGAMSFAALIQKAERERCAKIAEATCSAANGYKGACCAWEPAQQAIAKLIRDGSDA